MGVKNLALLQIYTVNLRRKAFNFAKMSVQLNVVSYHFDGIKSLQLQQWSYVQIRNTNQKYQSETLIGNTNRKH